MDYIIANNNREKTHSLYLKEDGSLVWIENKTGEEWYCYYVTETPSPEQLKDLFGHAIPTFEYKELLDVNF